MPTFPLPSSRIAPKFRGPGPITQTAMSQRQRTVQETTTNLTPAAVLSTAKDFFARQTGIYAAFPEQESKTHVSMRGQGGEEIVIAAFPDAAGGGTKVVGSTYLFDQ